MLFFLEVFNIFAVISESRHLPKHLQSLTRLLSRIKATEVCEALDTRMSFFYGELPPRYIPPLASHHQRYDARIIDTLHRQHTWNDSIVVDST